jgi:hypothetical protein
MAKKTSPAKIPADGATLTAKLVATTGPKMKTISSTMASHEYAVFTRWPSLLAGSFFKDMKPAAAHHSAGTDQPLIQQ